MRGLDANVVVRFFVNDDPTQFRQAGDLFNSLTAQNPGFISLVALAEFVWVLRAIYQVSKAEIVEFLGRLASSSTLMLESHDAVAETIVRFARGKADFADYLIESSGRRAGCSQTLTFDVLASRSASMHLLK